MDNETQTAVTEWIARLAVVANESPVGGVSVELDFRCRDGAADLLQRMGGELEPYLYAAVDFTATATAIDVVRLRLGALVVEAQHHPRRLATADEIAILGTNDQARGPIVLAAK